MTQYDVLIIGAGQAGLALAYHLKSTTFQSMVAERNRRLGDSWRKRYDTLTLFTPRSYSALPGLALSGDPNGYATRDEFADYLEEYSSRFQLPISLGMTIKKLERANGSFQATTDNGESILSRIVVLATGAFQIPVVPAIASHLSPEVVQFTADTYKNAKQLGQGAVLVVGDGATGRDVASELAASHRVVLATGRARRLLPERVLGMSIWWWLDKLGIMQVSGESSLGRFIRKADPFPARGKHLSQLKQKGIQIVPKLAAVDGKTVTFADGQSVEIDTVMWATGYRDDSDWVAIPEVKDERGNFIHKLGVSPVPNVYFIGRPWQRTRSSALITGVGEDARYIMEHILRTNPKTG